MRRLIQYIADRLPQPRIIYDRAGKKPYLSRYYILGAPTRPCGGPAFNEFGNPYPDAKWNETLGLYLHRFHRGDDDRALHNHPWRWSVSLILAGGYREERRVNNHVEASYFRPLSINVLRDDTFHRIDLLEHDCWSLFLAGPKVSSWGFWERETGRFTHWRKFISELRGVEQ